MKHGVRFQALVEHCQRHGSATTPLCAEWFGISRSAARFMLRRAERRGMLARPSPGVWVLAAGLAAAGVSPRILDLASRRLMVSIDTLERELGLPRKKLSEALGRLRKTGEMRRVRYGVWRRCA